MKRVFLIATWFFIAFFSSYQSASAATVHFADSGITGKKGSYEADLTYLFAGDLQATLTIALTNTSANPGAGYITALAFNNPGDLISAAVLTATNGNFSLIGQPGLRDAIAVSPYGAFDIGASISDQSHRPWLGGQNPTLGIGVGETGTFTFLLSGTALSSLDEQSFLDTFSFPDRQGAEFFAVRFRGSDKDMDYNPGPAVPIPPSIFLLGAGLLGLVTIRKRSH